MENTYKLDIKLIEIEWTICSSEQVENAITPEDYGVYQIYGDHPIYGAGVLLYIGKANTQTFGQRIPQHDGWFGWETINMKYYLGQMGGITQTTMDDWDKQINFAEGVLIYHCQPAWNSQGLNSVSNRKNFDNAIIVNRGFKGSLPTHIPCLDFGDRFKGWSKYSAENK